MNNFINKIILPVLFFFFFTSCDKEVTGVTYVTHLKTTSDEIVVNDPQTNNTNTYIIELQVNLENEETQKYLDQISKFELEKISLFFNGLGSLAGNQTPTHLKINIDNDIAFEYNNFVYDTVARGNPFVITDIEKINEAAELLFNNKLINLKIEGEIPDNNYHQFNIEIDVLAKIEVDGQ